ncbi:hypothetical protein PIB30_080696 [Stylosanthes scabra]|uniref:Retrotransposon Copia-like N-terminal domain-containing protein n=1 Tax=Stylosanthes scabra TaxID=79078 RepID=A0ABU6XQ62_9FABA|nr:hypothetical protein [Stylosanthes scabra]
MGLLLANSMNNFKSGLIPLTDKLDDKNYNTWRYQAWLTIQTLELEDHLDPTRHHQKMLFPSLLLRLFPKKLQKVLPRRQQPILNGGNMILHFKPGSPHQ